MAKPPEPPSANLAANLAALFAAAKQRAAAPASNEAISKLAQQADGLFTAISSNIGLAERHAAGDPTLIRLLDNVRIKAEQGVGLMSKLLPLPAEWQSAFEMSEEANAVLQAEKYILVVENDPVTADIAMTSLKGAGYTVVLCPDAASALASIAGGTTFDLVFSEIVMPGMDGVELAQTIAASHPNLRTLLATGNSRAALDVGAKRYPILAKPYTGEELARRIARMLP